MSEASRKLTPAEMRLVAALLSRATDYAWQDVSELDAQEQSDSGMGSLHLGDTNSKRHFGKQIAELTFSDADGVPVSASLNLDEQGELFELDIFKADFSPLIAIPATLDGPVV